MFRSVTGIARDLRQAPLFVHVYSKGGEDGDASLVTKRSVKEEDWEKVKGEWEKGDKALPEGVIFVEELKDDDEEFGGERRETGTAGLLPAEDEKCGVGDGDLVDALVFGKGERFLGEREIAADGLLVV